MLFLCICWYEFIRQNEINDVKNYEANVIYFSNKTENPFSKLSRVLNYTVVFENGCIQCLISHIIICNVSALKCSKFTWHVKNISLFFNFA